MMLVWGGMEIIKEEGKNCRRKGRREMKVKRRAV